jgi:hypothetical protein
MPGDYNGDGNVDARDYAVWRETMGQSGAGLAADGNNDGEVDALDYEMWALFYGQSIAGSGATAANVPEPASVFLWLIAMAGFVSSAQHRIRPC